MALSNIFNEPRREIIETIVGLAVMALPGYVTYLIASTYRLWDPTLPYFLSLVFAAISLFIMLMAVIGVAIFIHFVGEEVCEALDDRGIRLRPRDRR